MTKHIVGLVLFSFIVGTSAFVAGLVYGPSESAVTEAKKSLEMSVDKRKKRKRKKRCHPHRRTNDYIGSATVTGAVYDANARMLTTTFSFSRGVPENFDLDLHFYVRDNYGTRYLTTETLSASSWTSNYENPFGWIDRFEQTEDLYIIPRVKTLDEGWTLPPSFNLSESVRVKVANSGHYPGEMSH